MAPLKDTHIYVRNTLERLKPEILGLNTIETEGPYSRSELTQDQTRHAYIYGLTERGNEPYLSALFWDELQNLKNDVLVVTFANRREHSVLVNANSRPIRSVHVFVGERCYSDAYSVKNRCERLERFSFRQVEEIFGSFGIVFGAVIRQAKDDQEDMICVIAKRGSGK